MNAKDEVKQREEFLRWGIVIGALLSGKNGDIHERLRQADGPNDLICALMDAIQRGETNSVRGLISQLCDDKLTDGESAIAGVVRRVQKDALARLLASAQLNVKNSRIFPSAADWVEYVESQLARVKERE